jgi:phosphoribosylcarboxyaminoimidazole (NCAIR) mutase
MARWPGTAANLRPYRWLSRPQRHGSAISGHYQPRNINSTISAGNVSDAISATPYQQRHISNTIAAKLRCTLPVVSVPPEGSDTSNYPVC